jgi:hypothetical protein
MDLARADYAFRLSSERQLALERQRSDERRRRVDEEQRRQAERLSETRRAAGRALDTLRTEVAELTVDPVGAGLAAAALADLRQRLAGVETEVEAVAVTAEAQRLGEHLRLDAATAQIAAGVDAGAVLARLGASYAQALPGDEPTVPSVTSDGGSETGPAIERLRRSVDRGAQSTCEGARAACRVAQFRDRLVAVELDAAARRWAVPAIADLWDRAQELDALAGRGPAWLEQSIRCLSDELDDILGRAEQTELAFRRSQVLEEAIVGAMRQDQFVPFVVGRCEPAEVRTVFARGAHGAWMTATIEAGDTLALEVCRRYPAEGPGPEAADIRLHLDRLRARLDGVGLELRALQPVRPESDPPRSG